MLFYCSYAICCLFFFFNDTSTTEIYTLSLHDALPISVGSKIKAAARCKLFAERIMVVNWARVRSEEHTSELQSPVHLVCRLLLEKKKNQIYILHLHTYELHNICRSIRQLRLLLPVYRR